MGNSESEANVNTNPNKTKSPKNTVSSPIQNNFEPQVYQPSKLREPEIALTSQILKSSLHGTHKSRELDSLKKSQIRQPQEKSKNQSNNLTNLSIISNHEQKKQGISRIIPELHKELSEADSLQKLSQVLTKIENEGFQTENSETVRSQLQHFLSEYDQKLLQKIKSRKIRPIFQEEQSKSSPSKDLLIFRAFLLQKVIFKALKKIEESHQKADIKDLNEITNSSCNQILGELMGKTNIWRSLMVSKQQQRSKIVEMLRQTQINEKLIENILLEKQ